MVGCSSAVCRAAPNTRTTGAVICRFWGTSAMSVVGKWVCWLPGCYSVLAADYHGEGGQDRQWHPMEDRPPERPQQEAKGSKAPAHLLPGCCTRELYTSAPTVALSLVSPGVGC